MKNFEDFFSNENIANDKDEPAGWNHPTALGFDSNDGVKKPDSVLSFEKFIKNAKPQSWDKNRMIDGAGADEFDEEKE